jgi:hypothetical protein
MSVIAAAVFLLSPSGRLDTRIAARYDKDAGHWCGRGTGSAWSRMDREGGSAQSRWRANLLLQWQAAHRDDWHDAKRSVVHQAGRCGDASSRRTDLHLPAQGMGRRWGRVANGALQIPQNRHVAVSIRLRACRSKGVVDAGALQCSSTVGCDTRSWAMGLCFARGARAWRQCRDLHCRAYRRARAQWRCCRSCPMEGHRWKAVVALVGRAPLADVSAAAPYLQLISGPEHKSRPCLALISAHMKSAPASKSLSR